MPNPDTTMISLRLPTKLLAASDKLVKASAPGIRDRTQLIIIALTKYINDALVSKTP